MISSVFYANWNTFAFHKFTPWYGRVNTFISRMIESGLFNFWEERSVCMKNNISCHEFSSHRSWMEMWAEFKLRGEEPIDIYEKTQADPLFMEDCAGTFLLWLVMLACGPVG